MSLIGSLLRFYLERQAAHHTLDEIIQQLRTSQLSVSNRISNARENHANHQHARHIVGIERWGQHRLRCALGEPFVRDEVDVYILNDSHSGGHIAQDFNIARFETLALAKVLRAAPGIEQQSVLHNEIGSLSVKGWLIYLNLHARLESKKLH